MNATEDGIVLSATDLANHLACRHLTQLDLAVARGAQKREKWFDAGLQALWELGLEHEHAYVEHLRSQGLKVEDLRDADSGSLHVDRTLRAMHQGADAIVQADLASARWRGRADVLLRVDEPSSLGPWSYEAVDTKLAADTKATTVLQLCVYSELVGAAQGEAPKRMHVIRPRTNFAPETFRVSDYLAYYRFVKRRLESAVEATSDVATYPEPCVHCQICGWRWVCDSRRRDDDHLSLVAGIRRRQRVELDSRGIGTVARLAEEELPLSWRPKRGSIASLERVREQARVQVEARTGDEPVFEPLPVDEENGLLLLPEPTPGDVFFDLEGDRFAGDGGTEYLFGYCTVDPEGELSYWHRWAFDPEEEKAALEELVGRLFARWRDHPDFHIYHFSPYESAALKRLMGRYATCEEEVDQLLRGERFVDLLKVTRRSARCGVESYSLKELEVFSRFERSVDLERARRHIRRARRAVELGEQHLLDETTKEVVSAYNKDDCASLIALREWLEDIRANQVEQGQNLPRPEPPDATPEDDPSEKARTVAELVATLTADIPVSADERNEAQHATWLLAQMLDYHRRENKATWWEFFTLQEATAEDLRQSRSGVDGLELVGDVGGTAKCPVHRYRYPEQDTRLKEGDEFHEGKTKVGSKIEAWNLEQRTVDIKKMGATKDHHPSAGFPFRSVRAEAIEGALFAIGEWVAENGMSGPGSFRAARSLLLRLAPANGPDDSCQREGEDSLAAAKRWAIGVGEKVLPIQGPPGAGKTYTGARMVLELTNAGKRVGVTASSHKVIRNFLDEVLKAAAESDSPVSCGHKIKSDSSEEHETIQLFKRNDDAVSAILDGEVQILGGTAWLWARDELHQSVDVLFVDEAGQMALANTIAVAQATSGLVLLGDPQQLEQPQQGSHPEGCEASALEHLLDGAQTLAPAQGLFLSETYRLHPAICEFSSTVFYERRLSSRDGLENQAILGPHLSGGSGLWFLSVEHEGNQSSSPEEVETVVALVDALTDGTSEWRDESGRRSRLGAEHILVVAPYNDQVAALSGRLPGVRVGTVDKFQGREAPIVIYSLATSTPEDAPRGMEFLYSPSRLNVATSRARAACVLVGNPRIFEPDCRSPRQMKLANAFCHYLERARVLES